MGNYCLKGLEQIKYLLERHAILAPKKEKNKILIKDTTLWHYLGISKVNFAFRKELVQKILYKIQTEVQIYLIFM